MYTRLRVADTLLRDEADYNPPREVGIANSIHPVRWALIVALATPALLVLKFLIAKSTGINALAGQANKALRYVLGVELAAVFLFVAIGVIYEQRAQKLDRKLYPAPGRLIDIGGYRLHIDCEGKGSTVVLEYGQQGSYVDWHILRPQIADFARVCTYDRAGYGWSDSSPKPRVPSAMADELLTLLHSAGEAPPYILVGHSFGGLNALMFAHKFPSETAGVVLVDASLPKMMFPAGWHERMQFRLMQLVMPFGLPRWRGWCGGNAPEQLGGLKRAISCRSSLYGNYYRERSSFPQSASEIQSIPSIGSIPMIVIARDPNAQSPSAYEIEWNRLQRDRAKLSSNSEFVIADGSGHDVPIERPDLITAAVKLIQARVSSSAPQNRQ
jgi:pimeloyl-ACP methyl ester carboxylesterase